MAFASCTQQQGGVPFLQLLKDDGLPEALREVILYALAGIPVNQDTAKLGNGLVTTDEGIEALSRYIESVGRRALVLLILDKYGLFFECKTKHVQLIPSAGQTARHARKHRVHAFKLHSSNCSNHSTSCFMLNLPSNKHSLLTECIPCGTCGHA